MKTKTLSGNEMMIDYEEGSYIIRIAHIFKEFEMTKEEIKSLRIARGETQAQFAVAVGAAITTIARWEAGTVPRGLYAKRLEELAEESHFCPKFSE